MNLEFLANFRGREYTNKHNVALLEYIKFYEQMLKDIIGNLKDIKEKKLVYLIEEYEDKISEFSKEVDKNNIELTRLGYEILKEKRIKEDYEIINNNFWK